MCLSSQCVFTDDIEALSLIRHLRKTWSKSWTTRLILLEFLRWAAVSLTQLSSKCLDPGGYVMPATWCFLHMNFVGKQAFVLLCNILRLHASVLNYVVSPLLKVERSYLNFLSLSCIVLLDHYDFTSQSSLWTLPMFGKTVGYVVGVIVIRRKMGIYILFKPKLLKCLFFIFVKKRFGCLV